MKRYQDWLNRLGRAWANFNSQEAADLFSKDVEYYESALQPPCANWNQVLGLWQAIPMNQKEVTFDFDIVSFSQDLCVAHWRVNRVLLPHNTRQKIDGIFIFRINQEGLCHYFKQWRTVENY